MLSISNISRKQASSYYSKDNYYSKQTGKTKAGYDHSFSAPKSLSVFLEISKLKNDEFNPALHVHCLIENLKIKK